MKDGPRENFRWAPHTGGLAVLKPKDYEIGETLEAANPYAAWKLLMSNDMPLQPGDVLEAASKLDAGSEVQSELWISKYVGFEPAQWFVPEIRILSETPTLPPDNATAEVFPS